MKIIFVDAENIGLTETKKVEASVADKVFVFSRDKSFRITCEKRLFTCLTDYPLDSNQADFYIISYLSRLLSVIEISDLKKMEIQLYTNDNSLINAFVFQCEIFGALPKIIKTKVYKSRNLSIMHKYEILNELKVPKRLSPDFREKLGLSSSEFTKITNALICEKKIERCNYSKKLWRTI